MKRFSNKTAIKFLRVRLFWLLLLWVPGGILAQMPDCDCPQHPGKLSRKKAENFEIIILGEIDSLFNCSSQDRWGYGFIRIIRLFKGRYVPPHIFIQYPCVGACSFEFKSGQKWLFYGNRVSSTARFVIKVHPCERNRPLPQSKKNDDYTLFNEMTFEEETMFLRKYLLPAYLLPDSTSANLAESGQIKAIDANRNERFASPKEKLVLVILSLILFITILLVVRRLFRHN